MSVPPRSVHLHIERLVLHGFATGDTRGIADAVRNELEAAVRRSGVPMHGSAEIAVADGGTFRWSPASRPAATGAQIARAIHAGIGR